MRVMTDSAKGAERTSRFRLKGGDTGVDKKVNKINPIMTQTNCIALTAGNVVKT